MTAAPRLVQRREFNSNFEAFDVRHKAVHSDVRRKDVKLVKSEIDCVEPKRKIQKRASVQALLDDKEASCRKIATVDPANMIPKVEKCTPLGASADRSTNNTLLSPVSELGSIIAGFIFTPAKSRRSWSSSTPSSSSCSSDPPSLAIEDLVIPVQTTEVEATPKYRVLVMNKTGGMQWGASESGGHVKVSLDAGAYVLYAWKLDNQTFVFGFQDGNGTTHYVETPLGGVGNFLQLTTSGVDPRLISDAASDPRCVRRKFSESTGAYHLQPAHDESTWISVTSNGEATIISSVLHALSFDITVV